MAILNDGDRSSAATFMQLLEDMQAKGQSVLDDLTLARNETLFRFEQSLSALNGKRQRASRVLGPDVACRFLVSDLLDVNQTRTSGTLRIDTQSATCRQRAFSSKADIKRIAFSAAAGTVEKFGDIYRVHTVDDTKPTGILELELQDTRMLTLLVFDMVSMPSNPRITVYGSPDGITLFAATKVAFNGYRVNAWFPSSNIRYVQIRITPSMPDTLGGSTYTFGVTSLSAYTVDYYLFSEIASKPVECRPVTASVRFKTDERDLAYFLQFGDGPVMKVDPDEVLAVPGVEAVSLDTHLSTEWRLATGEPSEMVDVLLPADTYPSTLEILDVDQTLPVRTAFGFDPTDAPAALSAQFVAVNPQQTGWLLNLLPVNNAIYTEQSGRLFRVSYVHGPASIPVKLLVQLTSEGRSQSPVFRGAWLENVY